MEVYQQQNILERCSLKVFLQLPTLVTWKYFECCRKITLNCQVNVFPLVNLSIFFRPPHQLSHQSMTIYRITWQSRVILILIYNLQVHNFWKRKLRNCIKMAIFWSFSLHLSRVKWSREYYLNGTICMHVSIVLTNLLNIMYIGFTVT